MKYSAVFNFIHGKFVTANLKRNLEVISSIDGTLLSEVPMSGKDDLDIAVASAKQAFTF